MSDTVDYSKPVAWYCPRLGWTWRNPRHHAEECWGDTLCFEKLVPVYLSLPTPEKTTWGESGGADAVCAEYNSMLSPAGAGGVLDYVRGDDEWFETTAAVYDSGEVIINESTSGRPTGMNYMRCDIVTAINYVADGETE